MGAELIPRTNADQVDFHQVVIAGFPVGSIYHAAREVAPYDAYCHRGGGAMQCAGLAEAERFILRCVGAEGGEA